MSRPFLRANRLAGGTFKAEALTLLEINSTLESPAAALRATVAADEFPGFLGDITAGFGGDTFFTGKVDRQVASLSADGRLLHLEARSKGALLLDNEAVPCALTNAQLSTVYKLFAMPYGFTLSRVGDGRYLPLYTVGKGSSEWDALAAFILRAYGSTPSVRGDEIVVGPPRSLRMLHIGDGGYPYTKLEHQRVPYSVISKVVLRDADGNYTSAVHNSSADYYGAQRKRYVIPAGELAEDLSLDANQRIRRSMLGAELVSVTLPGIVYAEPGQEARVNDSAFTISNRIVRDVTWRADKSGIVTILELVNSIYYD